MIKSALLITFVPMLMLTIIFYSLWILMALNYSYYKSQGLIIVEPSQETFLLYVFKSQIDYLPYIGLFFIGVFFLGMTMAYLVLRPFNQLQSMCRDMTNHEIKHNNLEGLNSQKLIIRLGYFLSDFVSAKRAGKRVVLPDFLEQVKGPTMDWVFYFQFLCFMIIFTVITVTSINYFTYLLYEDLTQVALSFFNKVPKGVDTFLTTQSEIIDLIILVPSLICCIAYALIARFLIMNVEGITYAFIRDVRDIVNGNIAKRIRPRTYDPGINAAESLNELFDQLYPQTKKLENEIKDSIPYPSPI